MAPVGLLRIAGMPPYAAQVPAATTAAAAGASRSTHSFVVIGCPVSGLTPNPDQWPSPLISSFAIDPSTTSTNGSRRPSSASYHARMKSSPVSIASIGLCRTTRGMPGITPVIRSSMLGLVAEVIATDSPSQPRPLVIHRTWIVSSSVLLCFAYASIDKSSLSGAPPAARPYALVISVSARAAESCRFGSIRPRSS